MNWQQGYLFMSLEVQLCALSVSDPGPARRGAVWGAVSGWGIGVRWGEARSAWILP